MVNRIQVQDWLDRYVAAWRSYDRSSITDLFTPDAEYRYHPYDQPLIGAAAIAESWLESPDEPDSWSAAYEPNLIEGNRAVVTGRTEYDRGSVFWNLWTLEFGPDGRCSHFVEWYMQQP
jgi:hypothetical protein